MAASGNYGGGMKGGPNAGGNAGPMGGSKSGGLADRPDRGPHTGTVTPKYGWGDASMSDFGIVGGLSNMVGGILNGNTYSGRTPQGFASSQQRDLGALGAGAQGNTGQGHDAGSMALPGGSHLSRFGGGGMPVMTNNMARAQALVPTKTRDIGNKPWWRTPFPSRPVTPHSTGMI